MTILQRTTKLKFGGISVPLAGLLLIPVAMLGSIVLGGLIGNDGVLVVRGFVALLAGGSLGVVTLMRPHWGPVIILVSLPVQSVYPDIPLVSSFVGLFGMLTLLGYVLNKYPIRLATGMRPQFLFALGFVVWMVIANPEAALLPEGGRIWAWTYIQLLMLAWMGAQLLSASRQETLMRWYVLGASVSAIVAVYGFLTSEGLRDTLAAGAGLTGNKNELGSLLVPAVIMSIYLRDRENRRWRKRALCLLHLLLVAGCIATISRAALASLVVALLLSYWHRRHLREKSGTWLLLEVLVICVIVLVAIPQDYLQESLSALISPLTGIGETGRYVSPRVGYWRSAVRVWMEHPVSGVGIGRYAEAKLAFIEPMFASKIRGVAHNMYLSVVSETGTVGFTLFVLWLGALLRDLSRTMRLSEISRRKSLAAVWFVVVVHLCIVGLTHNVHYAKHLWIVSGIALATYDVGESRSGCAAESNGDSLRPSRRVAGGSEH